MFQAGQCLSATALRAQSNDVVVIDVRTPGEFEAVHLAHAVNIPLGEIEGRGDEIRALQANGKTVVLSCRTAARSHQAQERLVRQGIDGVAILDGGIVAWEADGNPVVRDVIRWDLERQVRLAAGSIVALSILVSIVLPGARFVAGFVGAGLVFAALSNTCAMAHVLSRLPYNRPRRDLDVDVDTPSVSYVA
ncbi:MAG: rhodanese-like domain-containing protein [Nitriliruptoraceae bacterium]